MIWQERQRNSGITHLYGGKVFMRKNEDSPFLIIKSQTDLDKLS